MRHMQIQHCAYPRIGFNAWNRHGMLGGHVMSKMHLGFVFGGQSLDCSTYRFSARVKHCKCKEEVQE